LRALKLKRYCRLGLNGIDQRLERYLGFDGGFFVEAGANNGLLQSNTYYLEAVRGWSGILIEPCPELFDACKRNRPGATVVRAALVSEAYSKDTISLAYAGLMTAVNDTGENEHFSDERVDSGRQIHELGNGYNFEAPARTLSCVFDECLERDVDFMSLDLEGSEANALKGLDLLRYRPRFLLVEVRDRQEIEQIIGKSYEYVATMAKTARHADILYRRLKK
jgi:FkbM family methyltransferase